MLPLLAFTGLYVLVYAGEPIKYAYLPIYMHGQLHFPAGLSGAIIGIQPLVEIVLMPLAVATASASASFMSSTALASALGGAAGGIGAAAIGLPRVFLIPAASALLAVAGLAAMARSTGRER
jgi:SET family sugar efflux transporter-like MFS transporter